MFSNQPFSREARLATSLPWCPNRRRIIFMLWYELHQCISKWQWLEFSSSPKRVLWYQPTLDKHSFRPKEGTCDEMEAMASLVARPHSSWWKIFMYSYDNWNTFGQLEDSLINRRLSDKPGEAGTRWTESQGRYNSFVLKNKYKWVKSVSIIMFLNYMMIFFSYFLFPPTKRIPGKAPKRWRVVTLMPIPFLAWGITYHLRWTFQAFSII